MSQIITLTVKPDFGSGPFLWINRNGADSGGFGPNCCSYLVHCGNHPMSAELLSGFSSWIAEFEKAPWEDYPGGHLAMDWATFHDRGLQLAILLKREVGSDFRVNYCKPTEDPAHRQDRYFEILSNGTVVPLRRGTLD